jgi:hypothetical protein
VTLIGTLLICLRTSCLIDLGYRLLAEMMTAEIKRTQDSLQPFLQKKRNEAALAKQRRERQLILEPYWFKNHLLSAVNDARLLQDECWPLGVQTLFYRLHDQFEQYPSLKSVVDEVLEKLPDVSLRMTLAEFMEMLVATCTNSFKTTSELPPNAPPECARLRKQQAESKGNSHVNRNDSKTEGKVDIDIETESKVRSDSKTHEADLVLSTRDELSLLAAADFESLSLQELEAHNARLTDLLLIRASVSHRLVQDLDALIGLQDPSFALWALARSDIGCTIGSIMEAAMDYKLTWYRRKPPTLTQLVVPVANHALLKQAALVYMTRISFCHVPFPQSHTKKDYCYWDGDFDAKTSKCTCSGDRRISFAMTLCTESRRDHCSGIARSRLHLRHYATLVRPLADLAQFWDLCHAHLRFHDMQDVQRSSAHFQGYKDERGLFGAGVGVGLLPPPSHRRQTHDGGGGAEYSNQSDSE